MFGYFWVLVSNSLLSPFVEILQHLGDAGVGGELALAVLHRRHLGVAYGRLQLVLDVVRERGVQVLGIDRPALESGLD